MVRTSSENGLKRGPRRSRMAESPSPNTLTRETLSSPGLSPRAQTTGLLVRCRPPGKDVASVLRNLPLRQTRADCLGRLLLRSIHTVDAAWAHSTACRSGLKRSGLVNHHQLKARPARLSSHIRRRKFANLPTSKIRNPLKSTCWYSSTGQTFLG